MTSLGIKVPKKDLTVFTKRTATNMSNFVQRRVEERTHVDLNGDGQIGRPHPGSRVEQATHVDINRDGFIGPPPPAAHPGVVGRIEQATHVDINRDGHIGRVAAHHHLHPLHRRD